MAGGGDLDERHDPSPNMTSDARGKDDRGDGFGLDCAGRGCAAAVLVDGEVRARRSLPMERGQAEALMPLIAAVLAEAGCAPAALRSRRRHHRPRHLYRPRIGIAAARGLALALGVPAIGITSFAAIAAAVPPARRGARSLVVALDSKREELYLQSFAPHGRRSTTGPWSRRTEAASRVAGGTAASGGRRRRAARAGARRPRRVGAGDGGARSRRCRPARRRRLAGRRGAAAAAALFARARDQPAARGHGCRDEPALAPHRVAAISRALARLHAACFPLDAWDATALAGLLAMRGASGRVAATEAGTIVGFLFDLVHGDEAEILTLGVDPPERRRGVARALLDDLFARARAAGAKRITLEVATDNAGALGLYRACGFRPVGRAPGLLPARRGAADRCLAFEPGPRLTFAGRVNTCPNRHGPSRRTRYSLRRQVRAGRRKNY